MKNLLKKLLAIVAMSICLTSCTKDVQLEFDDMTADKVLKNKNLLMRVKKACKN